MKRKVYVYQKDFSEELHLFFSSLNDNINVEVLSEDCMVLIDTDYYNEEPIDLEKFQQLLIDDFDNEVTIIVEPYMKEDFSLGQYLPTFIKELPHNVYYFDDLITYIVLKNQSLQI